jgi:putative BNR repeat neuraminidase
MRSRGVWIGAIVGLLLAASAWAQGSAAGKAAHTVSPGARVAIWSPGSWCWFADPRAVHVQGRYDQIFVGWIGWGGEITVGAYDPSFGVIRTRVIGYLYRDDHGSPSLFVEPDNRLTVFWSAHNGTEMHYRSTLRPEDITAWGPSRTVQSRLRGSRGFTYPNPVIVPAEQNRLYLFWRGADWGQDFATRTIDGRWGPAHRLITAPGERPYVKVDSDRRDTIGLAFTNGHPREEITSIYYAAYRHGSLWSASGRRIASLAHAPIVPRQADLVYDGKAAHTSGWVWDVAFDTDGRPVVVYATFPNTNNHAYWYAKWDGRRWVSHFLTFAGPSISPGTIEKQYSGGIALDHTHPSTLFLSRQVAGRFEIERWSTHDGGYNWQHSTVVRNGTDNVRPIVPRGWTHGPMGLLWLRGNYGSYTTYRTSIAFLR